MNTIDFNTITKVINVKKFLKLDAVKSLVIYSPTSVIKNKINLDNVNFDYYSTNEITKEKSKIDKKFSTLKKYHQIISIGGGTAIDIGKYLSYKFNIKLIAIPTMLSTNAYSTNKVALVVDNKVISLDATMPTNIYFDNDVLKQSTENNLYGIVDIFSIFTALNDWNLAIKYNNEIKSNEYEWANDLLNSTMKYISNNSIASIENDVSFVYAKIGESGLITNKYGSGKPESGSEHIFAKDLEKEINIPHAISVGNGIILMTIAQYLITNNKKEYEKGMSIISLLKKMKVFELNEKYSISYGLVEKVFNNLKPRKDRYSVVDLIYNNQEIKNKILKEYINILNLKED